MRLLETAPSGRPRERLARYGPAHLRDADLLAILIGSGTRHGDVLQTAERLLRRHPAEDLARLPLDELRKIPGIGPARACSIAAALELGRRAHDRAETEVRITEPRHAFELVRDLGRARKEHLVALYLDARNYLIHKETISIGGLNTTRTHPREILHPAIVHFALAFILVHNHPSGDLTPSRDDIEFTRAVSRAADLMGISLYDHLVVSRRGFVSLKEGQWL